MIAAIVQARMGSTRLPGKVLRVAAGRTLLEHLLFRLGHATCIDTIAVATTTNPADQAIVDLCARTHVACFRGSEGDVLDRYFKAAHDLGANLIVRITADCPLIDPSVVDSMVKAALAEPGRWDLITNRYRMTFPDGLDADVIPAPALQIAWERAATPAQREHVIPYFWEAGLRVRNIEHPDNLFATHRWTIDYEEDVALVTRVIEALFPPGRLFTTDEVLRYLVAHPDVARLNARYLPERSGRAG